MAEKNSNHIEKIGEAITEQLKIYAPELLDLSVAMGGIVYPAIQMVSPAVKMAQTFRLNYMLRGFSNPNDMEKKLNELYNYINTPSKAILVADCFQEAVQAKSVRVSAVIGRLLADLVAASRITSHEELEVLQFIPRMNDYDIKCFLDIYCKLVDSKLHYSKLTYNDGGLDITLHKLESAGMLKYVGGATCENGTLDLHVDDPVVVPNSLTKLLYEKILSVRQILDYGD